ncbi:hypothetical protein TNCV_3185351 [Trichonephila clavipes]|nr:hypothetical protein TNCV_3185351 [Trichonephila clavipes]
MIPAYNKKECAALPSRRESITGERPTSFPKKNVLLRIRTRTHSVKSRGFIPQQWEGIELQEIQHAPTHLHDRSSLELGFETTT